MDWFSEQNRQWAYSVATALMPLLVAVGVVAEGVAPLILGVVGAVLGMSATGMAAYYTHKQRRVSATDEPFGGDD